MNSLVFNCGSSSLNYKLFEVNEDDDLLVKAYGKAHRVGVVGTQPAFVEHFQAGEVDREFLPIADHRRAARLVLERLSRRGLGSPLVGHRFVHGGTYFDRATRITERTMAQLRDCLPLAPIHNPNSMSVIEACREWLGDDTPQYVSFDTAFHATLPAWAQTYALPESIRRQYHLRTFGFHGLSYRSVLEQLGAFLGTGLAGLRIIACHLGTGGSSVTAVKDGRSLATSMGYTPLPGLVMSTRSGDLDPLLPTRLMAATGAGHHALSGTLNKKSGLLGLSGFSSDIRDIIQRMDETDDHRARLAFDVYAHRLRSYIGSYAAILGGLDVLIFTDDVGLHSWQVRQAVCARMAWCGIQLDASANRHVADESISIFSAPTSSVLCLTVPTDEERIIAQEGWRLWQGAGYAAP